MVKLIFRNKTWEVRPGMTIEAALRKLGIDPEAVLPTIKDTLITADYVLQDEDAVKLVAVVSGGTR
ncbi:MAG: MoaD/ThiS family protein [Chloroflexi bacterium]|nr:MoaD/ThiS family protein [Chloroflexota bacterium]MBI3732032.1 MoaD/ThiS family protein [Chloroflexota bacterium]